MKEEIDIFFMIFINDLRGQIKNTKTFAIAILLNVILSLNLVDIVNNIFNVLKSEC